jgi:hypothetical protein
MTSGLRVAAALLLMTGSAVASHDPSGAPFDENFVTGTAGMEPCGDGCYYANLDAHSGPQGQNASEAPCTPSDRTTPPAR